MAAQTHITVNNIRHTTMNEKYISKACFGCFYFQCDSTPPPLQVLKGESVSSLERQRDLVTNIMCAHTHTEAILNPAFNTSYRKHRESSLLKKHGDET